MISAILESEPAKPRRRGKPHAAEASVVREYAEVIREGVVPVTQIAARYGVHRATVYRWLASASQ